MRLLFGTLLTLITIGALVCTTLLPASAQGGTAQIPKRISYQGYLTNGEGTPIEDPVNMTFSIYTASTSGTQVWSEFHSGVDPDAGIFSVELGSQGSMIQTWHLDGDRWLGVQVGGDPEMLPRQRLSSVPYSLRAEMANAAGALDSQDGSHQDVVYVDNDGDVGIGTTIPSVLLDITRQYDSTNTVEDMLEIDRGSTGSAGNGIGSGILFRTQLSNGGHAPSGRISSIMENALVGSASGGMLFETRASDGSMSSALYLDPDGNASIGTTTPSTKLDVDGTVKAIAFVGDGSGLTGVKSGSSPWTQSGSNIFYLTGNVGIGTGTPTKPLYVQGNIMADFTNDNKGSIEAGTLGLNPALLFNPLEGNRDQFDMYHDTNRFGFRFDDNPEPAGLYIRDGGNVGIGNMSPTSKLTVAGTIEATALTVAGTIESTAGGFKFPDGTTKSSANVKQIIQDFVVEAGQSVTAGDVVSFLDGYVSKYSDGWGAKTVFNYDTSIFISVATLSDTKFVVAFCDAGNSDYGTAIIGDVSGVDITFGPEYIFNYTATYSISVCALSSTKFVVAYDDNGSIGNAIIGTVSGATISYGSEYTFYGASTSSISATALSDSKFVVTYVTGAQVGNAIIGEVSGTVINYGFSNLFCDNTSYVAADSLSDTKFVVGFTDGYGSDYGTAVIGTVSGTQISYGSSYTFNSDSTDFISMAAFSSSKFVVAYQDEGYSNYGTADIGTVIGTSIVFGSEYIFNSGSTGYVSVCTLPDSEFVVIYRDDDNDNSGTAIIGSISGNSIEYGEEWVYNPSEYLLVNSKCISAFSTGQFVIAYYDLMGGSYGTAIIGEFQLTGGLVGIAMESKSAGQTVPVIIDGISDVHTGLSPGEVYYCTDEGDLTTTPTDIGIGLAISDTKILLDIERNLYQ